MINRRLALILLINSVAVGCSVLDSHDDRHVDAINFLASQDVKRWGTLYKPCFLNGFPEKFSPKREALVGGGVVETYQSTVNLYGMPAPCGFSAQYMGSGVYTVKAAVGFGGDVWLVDLKRKAVQYLGDSRDKDE